MKTKNKRTPKSNALTITDLELDALAATAALAIRKDNDGTEKRGAYFSELLKLVKGKLNTETLPAELFNRVKVLNKARNATAAATAFANVDFLSTKRSYAFASNKFHGKGKDSFEMMDRVTARGDETLTPAQQRNRAERYKLDTQSKLVKLEESFASATVTDDMDRIVMNARRLLGGKFSEAMEKYSLDAPAMPADFVTYGEKMDARIAKLRDDNGNVKIPAKGTGKRQSKKIVKDLLGK